MNKVTFLCLIVLIISCSNKKTEQLTETRLIEEYPVNISDKETEQVTETQFIEEYPVNISEVMKDETFKILDDTVLKVEQLRNNTLKIVDYLGNDKNIVIPSVLYNLPITSIGNEAFYNKGLISVIMPNSVIEIERYFTGAGYDGAFAKNNITFLALSKGLINIGSGAFYGNKNLGTVTIPDSTINIGDNAFYDCGLISVYFGSKVQSIGSGSFAFNMIENIDLPSSLREIGDEAFRNSQFAKAIIPNGVVNVGGNAFPKSVVEVVIPPSLANYDSNISRGNIAGFQGAFENPENLTRITLPANVDDRNFSIRDWSFSPGFETGFRNYYINQNKKAGTYVKNGSIWNLE